MITSFFKGGTVLPWFLGTILAVALLTQCKKEDGPGNKDRPSNQSSDVLQKWMSLQIRLIKNTTGVPNQAFSRPYGYSGIAALESIASGIPGSAVWKNKWNGLTGLPAVDHSVHYYYPANVNAAMAAINRSFFPNANAADKAAIDSLELALNESFLSTQPLAKITKSNDFGKAVAAAVFAWSETDGSKNANAPYTVPTGPGLWKPTPPAFGAPATPYWGNNRTMVIGSISNTMPPAPPVYSTDPSSPFFLMVKKVYDASLTLTDDQKAMAMFWRDVPGISSPGHWLSVLLIATDKTDAKLDKAALAYALSGAAVYDGLIACWKGKFQYNLLRPVTYIRETMGHAEWNSFIGTPAHPEYPSAHSSLSGAAAAVLEKLYGNIGTITDDSYVYLGFAARSYSSFNAIAEEAGISRLYAGIHYQQSIDEGLSLGKKVANNIFK